MEQSLLRAFEASLLPNNENLRQATDYLDSIKTSSGVIQSCTSIALSSQSLEIKQLSVIYLKNLTKVWKNSRRSFEIPEADKDFLKSHIIECLLFSIPDKIRSQFEEIAFHIAKVEFPWEEIMNSIDTYLNSGNADKVYAGLSMINQITKVYEQVLNEKRNNMKIIVTKFFSTLNSLLESLILEANITKFRYISLILQIYWTCFYIDLPEEQSNIMTLQNWLYKCKTILEMPMEDLESFPVTEVEEAFRENNPKWLCKKWAAQIIHRFFNRYFNIAYLKDHKKFIGEYFQTHWAVPLTELALASLLKLTNSYLPNSVSNYLLKFITQAFKLESTFVLLSKYNTQLITLVILPLLNRKPSDEELWQHNPIEYIRKEADMGRAYYSAKSSAIDLLIAMCEKNSLSYFIHTMVENLKNSPNLLTKESLMYAFGSLCKVIKTEKSFLDKTEEILFRYFLQEFSSSIGFLRCRACWVYSLFTNIVFTIPTHQETVFEHVCRLMLDPDLPVRIQAATALPKLLAWDYSKEKIGLEIQNVLKIYLELMGQIDSEDLVEALEEIVDYFSEEIIPFAVEFSKHLVTAFLSIVNKNTSDEGIMAGISILNTLSKIIDTLEDRPSDLLVISVTLQPIFEYTFTSKDNEYFECTNSILTSLLYYCPSNSLPHLFKYSLLLKSYIIENNKIKDNVRDFIEEIFAPLANFLKKYRNSARENIQTFIEIASVLSIAGYQETVTGCKIFMAILENIHLDTSIICLVLLHSYPVYVQQESKKIKMLFVQIVFVSLWRAPLFTVAYLNELSCFSTVFSFICENYMIIKEEIPLTQGILGLSSLISVFSELFQYKPLLFELFKIFLKFVQRLRYKKTNPDETFEQPKDPEQLNMLAKLKAMQFDENFEENEGELYESVFEGADFVSLGIKENLLKAKSFILEIPLTAEEKQILDEIMN